MKLGFARRDITPGFPVPMAGYSVKDRISRGVHDRLYARAFVFNDAISKPLILLQLDLLEVDKVCMEKIRQGLTTIPKEGLANPANASLLVCATHTHSGVGGIYDTEEGLKREFLSLLGENNPALVELIVGQSIEAIAEAAGNCLETTVRINRGKIDGVGLNRRRADIHCDNSILTFEFMRSDQKKILLYKLSCHPTVLNGKNLLLSADFPGAVAGKLEGCGYDMVAFINGPAGDMSTRYTRRESSFSECERYAAIIIGAIKDLNKGSFEPLEKIELHYYSHSLRLAKSPDPKAAMENLQKAEQNLVELKNNNASPSEIRKAESLVEGAQVNLIKSKYAGNSETAEEKTVQTGILKLNDSTIVCSPFELFSSLALILKKTKQIEFFCYANEHEGYLADTDAWDNLDYEALFSNFAYGEGEHYIELVSALL